MASFTNPNHGNDLPGSSQPSGLDQTKAQVDEVVVIMKQNVDKGTIQSSYECFLF